MVMFSNFHNQTFALTQNCTDNGGTRRSYKLKLLHTLKPRCTRYKLAAHVQPRCTCSNLLHKYCNITVKAPTQLHTLKPRCTRSNLAAHSQTSLHTLISIYKSAVSPLNWYNSYVSSKKLNVKSQFQLVFLSGPHSLHSDVQVLCLQYMKYNF